MTRSRASILMMFVGLVLGSGCRTSTPQGPLPAERTPPTRTDPSDRSVRPKPSSPPMVMRQGTVSAEDADREGDVALRLYCSGSRVRSGQPLAVKVTLINRGQTKIRVPLLASDALSFSIIGADRAAAGMSMDERPAETCELAPGESRECLVQLALPPRGEVRVTASFGELTSNTLTLTVVEN